MGLTFDKWTLLNVFELGFTISCLITKRVTDDEAARLFLYLQKLSREWSLLNNVTWDRIGSAVADATYGGYVIITAALLVGRVIGELPTVKRATEMVLLGLGAVLFVVLGSLEFAALDSVPEDLIDNAAVLGTLSLTTAALFLLDLAGPKGKKHPVNTAATTQSSRNISRALESHQKTRQDGFTIDPEFTRVQNIEHLQIQNEKNSKTSKEREQSGIRRSNNGHSQQQQVKQKSQQNGHHHGKIVDSGSQKHHFGNDVVDKPSSRFDIYGKDFQDSEIEETHVKNKTQKMVEEHSPVWSKIQKGQYGKYDIVTPSYLYPNKEPEMEERPPSSPGEPGYVQYTASRWGQPIQKSRPTSPTQV